MVDVTSPKYYKNRLRQLRQDQDYFHKESKDLVKDIALDSGDFDDPRENKKKRKDAFYNRIINSVAFSSSNMLASLLV